MERTARGAAPARAARHFSIWLCILCLQACVAPRHIHELGDTLPTMGAERALALLDDYTPPLRDYPQYLLDRGMLHFYLGDFAASIEDWQQAKALLADTQALSLSETAGALTINETLRSYAGTPHERVALHSFLALSYLGLGDLAGARVEVLQADVLMRQLSSESVLRGNLAAARYIGGVVFELNGEQDDALISYRKARAILQENRRPIPDALKASLDRLEEADNAPRRTTSRQQHSLFVFYFDGVVTSMRQHHLPIFAPELNQLVQIALPYYPPVRHSTGHLRVGAEGQTYGTETITDFDALARADLDARMPGIIAVTTARAVAKYQSVRAAQKEDEMAGLFLNLFTLATEWADTRSWRTLPATLQILRLPLPDDPVIKLVNGNLGIDTTADGRNTVVITSSLNRDSPTVQAFQPPATGRHPIIERGLEP